MATRRQWLHGELDRAIVDDLVKDLPDGTYLVRKRPVPDEYVLCVVYKQRPSHHLIKKVENSDNFCINNKEYGQNKSVDELIARLQKPCPGWPVPLSNPIPPDGNNNYSEPVNNRAAEQARAEQAREEQARQQRERQQREREAEQRERETEERERQQREREAEQREQKRRRAQEEQEREAADRRAEAQQADQARQLQAQQSIRLDEQRRQQQEAQERVAYQNHVQQERASVSIGGAGGSSSSDVGLVDLARSLARTVIKMGNRMTALEQQVSDLNKMVAEMKRGGRY